MLLKVHKTFDHPATYQDSIEVYPQDEDLTGEASDWWMVIYCHKVYLKKKLSFFFKHSSHPKSI